MKRYRIGHVVSYETGYPNGVERIEMVSADDGSYVRHEDVEELITAVRTLCNSGDDQGCYGLVVVDAAAFHELEQFLNKDKCENG